MAVPLSGPDPDRLRQRAYPPLRAGPDNGIHRFPGLTEDEVDTKWLPPLDERMGFSSSTDPLLFAASSKASRGQCA